VGGASAPTNTSRIFTRALLPAWAVLALSLFGTGAAWWYAQQLVEARARADLAAAADEIASRIARRMTAYEQVLHAGAALFAAADKVSREDWRRFVAHLRSDENFPGIQGIGFARLIPARELAVHERAVRAEGFPDYAVRPAGARDPYTSIVYLEPFSGRNLRAFGFDMYSEPVRRAAMQRACDRGDGALSGKVTLVQETARDAQAGFLLYVLMYGTISPGDTAAARRDALRGWTYAPFRMDDFMRALLGNVVPIVDFEVFDGETIEDAALLFDLGETHGYRKPPPAFWQRLVRLDIAGRAWTLVFRPQPGFMAGLYATPRLVLAGGGVIALLLFVIAAGLALARERAEAHAREIEDRNLRLAEAARMKTEFLNTMTHELKTPLNAIIGFSEMLASGIPQPLPPEQQHYAQDILDAGRHLLALLSDILAYSRMEAGELKLELAPMNLAFFLPQRLAALRTLAEAKQQRFAVDIDPAVAGTVHVDRDKLMRILQNLVGNAIKFTPEGGAISLRARRVFVGAEAPPTEAAGAGGGRGAFVGAEAPPTKTPLQVEGKGLVGGASAPTKHSPAPGEIFVGGASAPTASWLEIAVTDTGIGIAEADRPRLFQPFVQLEKSLTRQEGGAGLGLALAYRLAELHGGDISIDSTPGHGSTFTLRLPWREEPVGAEAPPTEPRPPAPT